MRRMTWTLCKFFLFHVALIVSAGAGTAYGQAFGTIGGTVRDNSGGVLPGVSVVARNLDTGVERTGVTNDAGFYRFPNIDPGSYQVEASLTGFKSTGPIAPVTVPRGGPSGANGDDASAGAR